MNAPNGIYRADYADRKEVVESLLGWLTPAQQGEFLTWCCQQLPPVFAGTRIEGPILGGKKESWHWFIMLCTQYGLNFERARLELERRARNVMSVPRGARRMILTGR